MGYKTIIPPVPKYMALLSLLSSRLPEEVMQKVFLTGRIWRDEHDGRRMVSVYVTPQPGEELRFVDDFDQFPSDELIAQIMLVAG